MQPSQSPIESGFEAKTTAREVLHGIDLSGKVAIVTGGYSGIGLETVRALAEAGATVVVPARSMDKARTALADIPNVELDELDLLNPESIDRFAARFIATRRPLHILINNAGISGNPLTRDGRGYESQFSANHLGHFQLTLRLWPPLVKAKGARVVALSSRAHEDAEVDFTDPNYLHRPYDKTLAYGQSKTATALFAVALDRRGREQGIRAFAVHPGAVLTDLIRFMSDEELQAWGLTHDLQHGSAPEGLSVDEGGMFKTLGQGAATSVWCATNPQLDGMGGLYCQDVDVARVLAPDSPSGSGVKPYAIDPARGEQLWELSEQLTGLAPATFERG